MTKDDALRLALVALEKLWNIIDDIDTYSDMAKADEKLYRSLVERRQRQRFEETGISTDGYELHGGAITAIKAALEAKDEPVAWVYPEFWQHLENLNCGTAYRLTGIGRQPLYTTPPQRTWVGLTNEEASEIGQQANRFDWLTDYSEAIDFVIEATTTKLKEKST
jgi:hypothetical protein